MARICGVPQVRAIDFFGMHMARTTCHCRRLALAARCRPAAATGLIVCPRKVIMVRSRTAQLIFQSFYVAIGLVGIVGSLGFYEHSFDDVFYVYFTNLSNYLCIAVMLLALIQTAQRKADGFVTLSPAVKFISVTAILLTFFVFNILLAGAPDRDPAQNFTITSISFHVVLPLLFVFDWILFYEHGRVKWTYPLYSTIFPLMYLAFVYIRAWMVGFNLNVPKLYPYFFINLDEQGVAGVVRWVVILLVAFIVLGYVLMGIDRALGSSRRNGRIESTATV